MSDIKTIDSLISAEQDKLDKLLEKREAIDAKIKVSKIEIERLKMMRNNQQFNAISNALDEKGISVEDILAAISAGDLLSLQDKIDSNENT